MVSVARRILLGGACIVAVVSAADAQTTSSYATSNMSAPGLVTTPPTAVSAALSDTDIPISVPASRAARVHEVHLLTIHCLCDGIDAMLLGED